MPKKLTTKIFIEKAKLIHGEKYDYSLSEYFFSNEKIKIICSEHGIFEQKPNNHLNGRGCYNCGEKERIKKQTMGDMKFIQKAKLIYSEKYDYSLSEYKNNQTKIKIKCKKHGIFELTPNCHLSGQGCPRCIGRGKTTDDFIEEAIIKHGSVYDYSLSEYSGTFTKIKIICHEHGIFEPTPNQHLNGSGCPVCNNSKGERDIRNYLIKNGINFIQQKRFNDCRDKNPLPFDFYIPKLNICIEYQGVQHFRPIDYFGGKKVFESQKKRDLIKQTYCKSKGINLIIIKFDEEINNKLINVNI
jgi:hypothetical protein